jgi:hypothetical protein
MFERFKKKPTTPQFSARDFLFGDMPFSAWPDASSKQQDHEPWRSFVNAREQLNAGNRAGSITTFRQILNMPNLESRHYLQAWHFLRGLGEQPTDTESKRLYGIVVEVGLQNGLDMVAAYTDGTARYFNYSGAAIIWERPNDSLDSTIEALLHLGQRVINQIGPWEDQRPSEPPEGDVRINLLAPGGLHFGQGPFEVLERDGLGGPLIVGATQLMQELIAKSEHHP